MLLKITRPRREPHACVLLNHLFQLASIVAPQEEAEEVVCQSSVNTRALTRSFYSRLVAAPRAATSSRFECSQHHSAENLNGPLLSTLRMFVRRSFRNRSGIACGSRATRSTRLRNYIANDLRINLSQPAVRKFARCKAHVGHSTPGTVPE